MDYTSGSNYKYNEPNGLYRKICVPSTGNNGIAPFDFFFPVNVLCSVRRSLYYIRKPALLTDAVIRKKKKKSILLIHDNIIH